ncbi:MAG: methyl-accepting chemotaxis protein [Candidatus Competibacteraceae bacterium]|jgi:methyl-accepting chemotaxis protein
MFSIRSKLILFFAGAGLLVFGIIFLFSLQNSHLFENLRDSEVKGLFMRNIETVNRLVGRVELSALNIAAGASALHTLKQAAPNYNVEPAVKRLLTTMMDNIQEAVGAGFWFEPKMFDPQQVLYGPYVFRKGNALEFTWEYNTPTYNYLKNDWYLEALPENWDRNRKRDKNLYWTTPYYDEVSKVTMVTADAFIYDAQGKILGLATTDWALDGILDQLNKNRITPGMESFVIDAASGRIVLYTPDAGMKLKQSSDIPWLTKIQGEAGKVGQTSVTLNNALYRTYYSATSNGYLYGVMIPDAEFMPEIRQIIFNSQVALIVVFLVMLLAMIGIYRSIRRPVLKIADTVRKVGGGNYAARTGLAKSGDELAQLGHAFDEMLDERMTTLVKVEQENEKINDSIIGLLQAVSQLSQRDLTVRVPVTEDMTGPVADALNLLTGETAKVLQHVTRVSVDVATASDKVKAQSDAVIAVADAERQAVEQTATDLAAAVDAMQQIANLAHACNVTAETAMKTTQAALSTVTGTVSGINSTRDTIRETEKRIKRLGERSQEISGVVNLINTIAERTHILALNASMHAASAGEAGRGFAVVADEVQRLAENAREATSQISTLVSNIQIETADTASAMNTAISQVVDGSRLAEQAGNQMRYTQETTADLVAAVQQIAARSQEQSQVSTVLLDRAQQIQESTRQTQRQMQEQIVQTTNLVEYAQNLLSAVRVFRLPG